MQPDTSHHQFSVDLISSVNKPLTFPWETCSATPRSSKIYIRVWGIMTCDQDHSFHIVPSTSYQRKSYLHLQRRKGQQSWVHTNFWHYKEDSGGATWYHFRFTSPLQIQALKEATWAIVGQWKWRGFLASNIPKNSKDFIARQCYTVMILFMK